MRLITSTVFHLDHGFTPLVLFSVQQLFRSEVLCKKACITSYSVKKAF